MVKQVFFHTMSDGSVIWETDPIVSKTTGRSTGEYNFYVADEQGYKLILTGSAVLIASVGTDPGLEDKIMVARVNVVPELSEFNVFVKETNGDPIDAPLHIAIVADFNTY